MNSVRYSFRWSLLIFLLAMLVPTAIRSSALAASPPPSLSTHDWQTIQAQLPTAPTATPLGLQQRLTGSTTPNSLFAWSVALSSDGMTALVGAYGENSSTGAAYVFIHSGTSWTLQQRLTGPTATNSNFGYTVALSADGNTALIGSYGENSNTGAAYVFTRSGTTWTQEQRLASSAVPNSSFGLSVVLSADGNTALIGAFGENSNIGAAYVFVRSGTTWTQQQRLTGSTATNSSFGARVALSGDSNTALVGANGENTGAGAAYVFVRSGTTWTLQQRLSAPTASSSMFGVSVTLNSDGNTALIGAYGETSGTGAAYVFVRSGTTWTQQQRLTGPTATASYFGWGVDLTDDGNMALIGAWGENSETGAAYVFTRSGTTWTQQQRLTGPTVTASYFGLSVALSGDGSTVLIGAPGENSSTGAAYSFNAFKVYAPLIFVNSLP